MSHEGDLSGGWTIGADATLDLAVGRPVGARLRTPSTTRSRSAADPALVVLRC